MFEFMIIVCVVVILFCCIMLLKNNNTFKNHVIISDAIAEYAKHLIDTDLNAYRKFVKESPDKHSVFSYAEDYDKTLWRLWDWGYTRILPPDIFELIKPFIKEGKK